MLALPDSPRRVMREIVKKESCEIALRDTCSLSCRESFSSGPKPYGHMLHILAKELRTGPGVVAHAQSR